MRTILSVVALLLTLCACGTANSPAPETGDAGGDSPTTPAALAFAAAQHVGDPSSATTEHDISEELGAGAVGADLQYRPVSGSDGDRLTVAVGTKAPDEVTCAADHGSGGCVETKQGTVFWEKAAVGEDPGNVAVVVKKGEGTVLVFQSGPNITRDPRALDLPITVEDMFAIASDQRVDVTTSQDALTASADLPYWKT